MTTGEKCPTCGGECEKVCCNPEQCHFTCDCHYGFRFHSTAQQRIEEWKQRLWNLEDAVETEGEKTDAQLDAQREQIDTLLARVERAERDFEKAVKGLEANAKYIRKQDDEIDAMGSVCEAAEAVQAIETINKLEEQLALHAELEAAARVRHICECGSCRLRFGDILRKLDEARKGKPDGG